ncbi:MAG: hypothetical protein AAFZ11_01290 [Pseudomonadota bacterium]
MKALFRCDATAQVGFGHLSRCLALAEALRLEGVAALFAGQFDDNAQAKIGEAGFDCAALSDPVNTREARDEVGPILSDGAYDFVVLDSYQADETYLAGLAAMEPALVAIDDFRLLAEYPCDAVLNFTWEAPELGYLDGPALLLGPNYLLVRRTLVERRAASAARERPEALRNLLVLIGGADPKGLTRRLVQILSEAHTDLCLRVIAEDTDPMKALVSQFADGSAALPRQPDISDHLAWADAAVTGGGLIKYESAYMGVPVAAIAQNEGQDGETQVFARAGLVYDLGLADAVSDTDLAASLDQFLGKAALRQTMAARMREAFVPDPSANAAQTLLEAIGR